MFTNEERTLPYRPKGGGKTFPTPIYNFEYTNPFFGDDKPWVFTKTGRSGGVGDWTSPERPNPIDVDDPDDPDPNPPDEGMDFNLIMLAVVLMVAAAVAVHM